MEWTWVRGKTLGRGSNGIVSLAEGFRDGSLQLCAVKSSSVAYSSSLQHEEEVLTRLGTDCPQIISCFGHDITLEDDNHKEGAGGGGGHQVYNLFLEYISGGTLLDHMKGSSTGRLAESEVKRFTKSLLQGLSYMHGRGYVHCDIKPDNILVSKKTSTTSSTAKIADFGTAKEVGRNDRSAYGTPLYMSPEALARGECEPPMDIWSLGCVVSQMVSGKPAWKFPKGTKIWDVYSQIGHGGKLPEIPMMLSHEGKDFLSKCFVIDPSKRWTADMLLNHPFLANNGGCLKSFFNFILEVVLCRS